MTEDSEVVETDSVDPVEIDTPEPETTPKAKTVRRKTPVIDDPADAILELRKENEKLRKKLEADTTVRAEKMAEQRIKQAREEAVAESQRKLDERIIEMEERARARVLKAEVKSAASRAGVADFDDLYAVMSATKTLAKIEFDADGNVTNVGEIVAEMKTSKPHLFGGVNTSSSMQPPVARQQHVPEKSALLMSKEDYERAKQRLNTM